MASVGPTPCSGLKSDIASPIPKAHFGSLAALVGIGGRAKRLCLVCARNITEIEGVSTRRPLLARRQRQVCSHSAAGRFDGSWLSDIAHDPLAFVEGAFPSGEGELANFDGPMDSQAWVLTQIRDGLLTPGKAIQTCWITLWAMTKAGNTRGIITSSSDDKSVCKVYWHT